MTVPHPKRPLLVLTALLAASAATLRGETVVNQDGEAYSGKVTVGSHVVKCVSPGWNRTFALSVVAEITLSAEERVEFEVRRRKLVPLDAEGHYRLGLWLKSKYQHGEAQEFFRKTVTINPNHYDARRELGEVLKDDRWEYSPPLHHRMMIDWVGKKALAFHLKLAQQLHQLKLVQEEEKELRRVLQADPLNADAIGMIRPIVASYRLKNRYRLPFEGTWMAVSGPDYGGHGNYAFMMNAWDFRKVDEQGRLWSGPPDDLKNHLTYEQPVYACADGEVYEVRDKYPDNPLGTTAALEHGNRVLIRHESGERSATGHLLLGTAAVKVGDKVKQGQLIGRIGNSGSSATPHLHFAVFDEDGISLPVTFVNFRVKDPTGFREVESGTLELGRVYDNAFEKPGK